MGMLDTELELASNVTVPAGAAGNAISSTHTIDVSSLRDVGEGDRINVVFLPLVDVAVAAGAPTRGHWLVLGATDVAVTANIRILGQTPGFGDPFHFGGIAPAGLPVQFSRIEVPLASEIIVPALSAQGPAVRAVKCFYRNLDFATANYDQQNWRIYMTIQRNNSGRIYPASTSS